MAVQILGADASTKQAIDPAFQAARTSIRPVPPVGWYSVAASSGAATTVAANGAVFSLRNASTNLLMVRRVDVQYTVTTGYTTAQAIRVGLIVGRNWTTSDSGGTAIALTGNNCKHRTSLASPTSLDCRIATTAALTAGTKTLDTNQLGIVEGWAPATTAGVIIPKTTLFDQDTGDYPLILQQNEGINIQNLIVGGAAGVGTFTVNIEFAELTSY